MRVEKFHIWITEDYTFIEKAKNLGLKQSDLRHRQLIAKRRGPVSSCPSVYNNRTSFTFLLAEYQRLDAQPSVCPCTHKVLSLIPSTTKYKYPLLKYLTTL